MKDFFTKRCAKFILSLFIVLSLIGGAYAPTHKTPTANAQWIVADLIADIETAVTAIGAWYTGAQAAISAWANEYLKMKEGWLDGVAWYAVNLILQQLTQETINWINSGFQGSPAFVTNLGGFMQGIGDEVAGNFLEGTALNFLCSPLQLDIKLALNLQYKSGRDFGKGSAQACTLSKVTSNVESFMNGNFLAGGWDGWFQMTTNAQNNPYGAMLLGQWELSERLSNARGQEYKRLDFGNGFLSRQECFTITEGPAAGVQECQTVTPGSTIKDTLDRTLGIPVDRIMVADEINEIIAALFTQLAKMAMKEAGGLVGLTNSKNGSGLSYLDRVGSSTLATTTEGYSYVDNTPRPETPTYQDVRQTVVGSQSNSCYEAILDWPVDDGVEMGKVLMTGAGNSNVAIKLQIPASFNGELPKKAGTVDIFTLPAYSDTEGQTVTPVSVSREYNVSSVPCNFTTTEYPDTRSGGTPSAGITFSINGNVSGTQANLTPGSTVYVNVRNATGPTLTCPVASDCSIAVDLRTPFAP